ncbi:hypothetical protein AB0C65_38540 [Nocardia sp. NPDC048505]|uniref:hypothetical protein n=1 Tax=Nocardia sp. NPDC048505 TaxID=3155756 RepID=UPI0033F996AD
MPFVRTSPHTRTYLPDMVACAADLLDTARTSLELHEETHAEGEHDIAARHHANARYWLGRGFVVLADLAARESRDALNTAEAADYPARMSALNAQTAELWTRLHPQQP